MGKSKTTENEFQRVANRVSFITIVQNALLSIFKLVAGIFAHSNAMISDAIHSASDKCGRVRKCCTGVKEARV